MEEACAVRQAIEDTATTKEKSLGLTLGSESESDSEGTICSFDAIQNPTMVSSNRMDCSQDVVSTKTNQLSIVNLTNTENSFDIGSSEDVTSDSDSSEAEIWAMGVKSAFDERGKLLIKNRRATMRRKTLRTIKKRLAEKRFLCRRRSTRIGKLLSQFPNVGKDIEDFVKECGARADAWRRTSALTLDGNRKVKCKATFKRIQEYLEGKYNIKISYGTIVQLCIARNKRSKSSLRYKGVANVVSKRARKGFNIRYNPDIHWSAAFYRGLEAIFALRGSKPPQQEMITLISTCPICKQHPIISLRHPQLKRFVLE